MIHDFSARDYKGDCVSSLVYMIRDRNYYINVDKCNIRLLLAEWYVEDCIYVPMKLHIRESYDIKSQSHDTDTTMYMESLSGEH